MIDKDNPTSLRIILKIRYQKTKPNCVMKALQSLIYMFPHWCKPQFASASHAVQEVLCVTRESCRGIFMIFSSSNLVWIFDNVFWRELGVSLPTTVMSMATLLPCVDELVSSRCQREVGTGWTRGEMLQRDSTRFSPRAPRGRTSRVPSRIELPFSTLWEETAPAAAADTCRGLTQVIY